MILIIYARWTCFLNSRMQTSIFKIAKQASLKKNFLTREKTMHIIFLFLTWELRVNPYLSAIKINVHSYKTVTN